MEHSFEVLPICFHNGSENSSSCICRGSTLSSVMGQVHTEKSLCRSCLPESISCIDVSREWSPCIERLAHEKMVLKDKTFVQPTVHGHAKGESMTADSWCREEFHAG